MKLTGTLRNVEGISNTTQGIVDTLGRLGTGSYWSQLKPASFAGIPFGVFAGTSHFGRRTVVHQYPFRDQPYVEDLGRAAQRLDISGFLVGDDVIAQRKALIKRAEQKGEADLVHPTLGLKRVVLVDFAAVERWDRGRVFEIELSFVEQGKRQYPTTATSGSDKVGEAAADADGSSLTSFVKRSYTALKSGASAVNEALKQASAWSKRARQVGNDATSLLNLASSLPGEFGRLLGQSRGIAIGQLVPVQRSKTVRDLEGASSASRVQLGAAAGALDQAAAVLTQDTAADFATAAQGLASAIATAAPTPGDALRALVQLADFDAVGSLPVGDPLTVRIASLDVMRRAAIVEMVRVASQYQPASADDAAGVRELVSQVLDAAITATGDQGEDDVYAELRTLRAECVRDLNDRGAQLPTLRDVTTGRPMPSLVLAQRLYRDPTRSDELVRRGNPRHPAFMPVLFEALSE